ncbi:unnamed protein product [Somion occarium]
MTQASGYFGPVDETASDIFWEKTWMAAGYLAGVGFGMQFVLYCICAEALWKQRTKPFSLFFLGFVTVLCALNCVYTGVNAYGLQDIYIDNRNYPGGPWAYLKAASTEAFNISSSVAYFTSNIMADALLLWRCKIIWTACIGPTAIYFMIFPALMLLASTALAITAIHLSITGGFFTAIEGKINLSCYTLSLSLNIILTAMIVGQMWTARQRARTVFGGSYGKHYNFVSTMFIESAALYSIVALLLLITYGMDHQTSQIWLALAPAAQVISNYLIIYRVAQGRAWTTASLSGTFGQSMPSNKHAEIVSPSSIDNDGTVMLQPTNATSSHSLEDSDRGSSMVWAAHTV